MMRVYHDWEFLEDGSTIEPISVGMVAEDGREYYAVFADMPSDGIGFGGSAMQRYGAAPATRPSAAASGPRSTEPASDQGSDFMTAHSDCEELCGEESLAAPGLRCGLPKNHDVHRKGGTVWATDWDAWRAEIEQEVRAKVAEEIEAMCPTPHDEHAGGHCDFKAAAQAIRGGQ